MAGDSGWQAGIGKFGVGCWGRYVGGGEGGGRMYRCGGVEMGLRVE